MKWGVRRYQNKDGSLTPEGEKRYGNDAGEKKKLSTGAKVAIGVGAAAAAGTIALFATGAYKEIPGMIRKGKEAVELGLVKAGFGKMVYGEKEWENQVQAARNLEGLGSHLKPSQFKNYDAHLRRIQNNTYEIKNRLGKTYVSKESTLGDVWRSGSMSRYVEYMDQLAKMARTKESIDRAKRKL